MTQPITSPFLWKEQPRQTTIGDGARGNRAAPARKAEEERQRVLANRWGSAYLKPGRVD